MTPIEEQQMVVLTAPVAGTRLASGDVGTVVFVHDSGAAYEVEFCAADGTTLDVCTVPANQLQPASSAFVMHARPLSG
ncbi:MAG: DUF4926 domain-containing protein [Opitutales bacterium]